MKIALFILTAENVLVEKFAISPIKDAVQDLDEILNGK